MTPTPFWPRGLPAFGSAPSHLSSPDCCPNLTGYRLARVIVQRYIFVKKFCRPTARHPTNRTAEPFQLTKHRTPCSKSHTPASISPHLASRQDRPATLHSYNRLDQ